MSYFHVVWDDIMGRYFGMILQYFGMKIYDDFFSQLKSKKTSYLSKTVFFLSLPVEKENEKFSSQKRYRNIIPN